MMAFCAAVDWGTSNFRLWLLDRDGKVILERRSDQGLASCTPDRFEQVLESHLTAAGVPSTLPVLICGMAGSRQGWVEAPYRDIPAALDDIAGHAVRVPNIARDVRVIPGIAQRDRDAPDVMRGEETQLIGALGEIGKGQATACIPGTHSKWVELAEGKVRSFRTFMSGDFFAALRSHTVLSHSMGGQAPEFDPQAFGRAVSIALADPAALTANLFRVRSGQLLNFVPGAAVESMISGLLIGTEIAAVTSVASPDRVCLIASGTLVERYGQALALAGIDFSHVDADACVRRGLHNAALALFSDQARGDAA